MPEHFILFVVHQPIHRCGIDRTLFSRVGGTIGMGMMMHVVRALAEYVLGLPAENGGRSCISKSHPPVFIDAVNTLTGGIQDELLQRLQLV